MISFRNKLGSLTLIVLITVFLTSIQPAHAFKLIPITMDFEPSGRRASQSFRLENGTDQPIPVQVSMLTREMDINGKETNLPADDDFVVYPPQILLKPKQTQTVRVKWVGNPKPDQELAFRIQAEQLPVSLSKEEAEGLQIKVVIRYLGSVYVVPKGAKSNINVESAKPATDSSGNRKLEIVLHNRGTAHALLHEAQLRLTAGEKTVALSSDDLKGLTGENILAGKKRRFLLSWPSDLPDLPLKAVFNFAEHKRAF